jgi:hypothetical protein
MDTFPRYTTTESIIECSLTYRIVRIEANIVNHDLFSTPQYRTI